MTRFSLIALAAASCCSLCPAVLAQDFFGAGVSASTAARAGIYLPSSFNVVDALAINPAGLSALGAPTADLSALGLLAQGSFSNRVNSQSPMRFNAAAIPFGGFGMPLGHSRWTVAAGFMPDLLSASKWQFRDAPGVGGASYGTPREQSQILAFRATAGAGYRISSRLYAGFSVSGIYNSNTLIMPYVFQSHPALAGLKTALDLHTNGAGWNTNFGLFAKASRRFELGGSFRTRSTITSDGTATGSLGAQFAALHIPFPPDYAYRAQVRVQLPQAATVLAAWQQSPVLRLSFQSTWTDWKNSFYSLPVSLTNGNNASINSFLNSNAIRDEIPLRWKDQFSFRGAIDHTLTEALTVSAGYSHENSPVPSSTLSPLTAAIMQNGLATGLGYRRNKARYDLAYQVNLPHTESVGISSLLSGEFSGSRTRIMTQALTISTAFTF